MTGAVVQLALLLALRLLLLVLPPLNMNRVLPETVLDDPGWGLENVVDELLRMCEQDQKPNSALAQPASGKYAKPVTDDEVTKARYKSVPKKTRDDSAYCVRLWEDWAKNRQKMASVEVPPLSQLDKQGLKYWLSRFVMEVIMVHPIGVATNLS